MILLNEVLAAEDVARVVERLGRVSWRDGRATAGPSARAVKDNLQAAPADVEALERFVAQALDRHPLFAMAARPKRLSRLIFSRYAPGMEYGAHTDDALMGPPGDRLRTDLAFTLFLAAPATYEGGALVVTSASGEERIKLPAGSAVLYPAGSIHFVEPVIAGERLACVGWVQSTVRDAGAREILFDLSTLRARHAGPREDALLLDKAISNLLRMWAEV